MFIPFLTTSNLGATATARLIRAGVAASVAVLLSGCGTIRETLPPRSATEQLLISTAADRAIAKLSIEPFSGKTVYLDATNLDCLDKPYVLQRIRTALRAGGARVMDSRDHAEFILETGVGALSINKRDMLFGIPSLPLPSRYGDQIMKLPEVALWKTITYCARAKFLFSAVHTQTGERVADIGHCYGKVRDSYWWLLIVGPMRNTDLPEEAK